MWSPLKAIFVSLHANLNQKRAERRMNPDLNHHYIHLGSLRAFNSISFDVVARTLSWDVGVDSLSHKKAEQPLQLSQTMNHADVTCS